MALILQRMLGGGAGGGGSTSLVKEVGGVKGQRLHGDLMCSAMLIKAI